ncbi:MAG: helix-turn-helix domain-containing protein [bacterium]|nr:helix-turn-helix domain-containing protein [bacterium]
MSDAEQRAKIGERIRKLRERAGLSQQELSDLSGISRVHLSGLERGVSSPTVDKLLQIARALKMQASDLLEGNASLDASQRLPDAGFGIYPALQELLESANDLVLYQITPDEIELLKSVRFQQQTFQPSKQFFLDVLLDLRRRRGRNGE